MGHAVAPVQCSKTIVLKLNTGRMQWCTFTVIIHVWTRIWHSQAYLLHWETTIEHSKDIPAKWLQPIWTSLTMTFDLPTFFRLGIYLLSDSAEPCGFISSRYCKTPYFDQYSKDRRIHTSRPLTLDADCVPTADLLKDHPEMIGEMDIAWWWIRYITLYD